MLLRNTEAGREINKLVLVLLAIAAFFACMIGSCNELRYIASGKRQQATVNKMEVVTHRSRRSSYEVVEVTYTIIEADGSKRQEIDEVAPAWIESNDAVFGDDDQTIAVQYLPGVADRSRIVGHSHKWLMIPFVLSLGAMGYVTIRFWREFNEHQRQMARSR